MGRRDRLTANVDWLQTLRAHRRGRRGTRSGIDQMHAARPLLERSEVREVNELVIDDDRCRWRRVFAHRLIPAPVRTGGRQAAARTRDPDLEYRVSAFEYHDTIVGRQAGSIRNQPGSDFSARG